ncbi:MAG: DUF4835 family protein [Bacteroidota bacterium]|jgi:hypothetical protein|nr:DUF4835 family protein [Bacteroidota bacterium]|tara:strand:+ start:3912 stop:4808 length:897 start_codon:yes stop_codon:yes gene_type:complete
MRFITYSSLLLFFFKLSSQQLNCEVVVNSNFINQTEKEIFINLERNIESFLNTNDWDNQSLKNFEKIDCTLIITVLSYSDSFFNCNFEVKSFRPVYNTDYNTNIFLFKDNGVSFNYESNQYILRSDNRFESDLASILEFYANLIIGLDKDTFALNSGKSNFLNSKKILDFASSNSQSNMWSQNYNNGRINKYWLVENLVSPNYSTIKEIYYDYHRRGLDVLIEDKEDALQTISETIGKFNLINRLRPNSIMQQMFFQSKNDEIISLYKNHNNESYLKDLKKNLNRIAPFFSDKWNSIK